MIESELTPVNKNNESSVLRLEVDLSLKRYFESMISHFLTEQNTSKQLLKLKVKELILQIVTTNINEELTAFFFALAKEEKANLKQIMLDNYLFCLSREGFAKLATRSLSSFKRDFQEVFQTTFSKWLTEMRLKYARVLLLTTEESISEVADQSGFDTTTHLFGVLKSNTPYPRNNSGIKTRENHTKSASPKALPPFRP